MQDLLSNKFTSIEEFDRKRESSMKKSKKYSILVIDDEKAIQTALKKLMTLWGFEVFSALTSFDGLELAIEKKPTLIILDIGMPEVKGDIMLKFFKRLTATKEIPVIIISGILDKNIIANAFRAGAIKFITKPFTQKVLLKNLKECLNPEIVSEMKLSEIITE